MTRRSDPASELVRFLEIHQETGLAPIVWVGAGASAAAGYPTLERLARILGEQLPDADGEGFDLVDAFVDEYGETTLATLLQKHLAEPRGVTEIHTALARLAGAGVCPLFFTTNYDRLVENALTEARVAFLTQVLEANYELQHMDQVQVLKLHGDQAEWLKVVLTSASYSSYEASYPLLTRQLDLNLRTRPLLFVGCSMTDPRLLDWLAALPADERKKLHASRAILRESEWNVLPEPTRELLAGARIRPILVDDFPDVPRILAAAAKRLAPLDVQELVFDLEPGEETWTTIGPTPESGPHRLPNPLADAELLTLLDQLRELASRPLAAEDPRAANVEALVRRVAEHVGTRLASVILSDEARQAVTRRINAVDLGRARLTLRVAGSHPLADRALALPWELLVVDATFPVESGRLDVVREAVVDGGPELPASPPPLRVAATISAPQDQTALNYEQEEYRLYAALSRLGHQVAFADLGGVEDLVEVVAVQGGSVIHFSGHGLPGQLVFEDAYGFADVVDVSEVVGRLHTEIGGRGNVFPSLFFLASCHGASGTAPVTEPAPEEAAEAVAREGRSLETVLGQGPSTAATLHRSGFAQVIGYFGPVGDELCTRAEEAFYSALAKGEETLQAVAQARATLARPLEMAGQKLRYPFAWAQLAVYHRGPDRPLATTVSEGADPGQRFHRRTVQVSGLPVLEFGFIGRRGIQHEVRRKVRDGERLVVLQGLGGLGKTALASQLLSRVLASKPENQLILRCRDLDEVDDPVADLRGQAEEHGRSHQLPDWDERAKGLQETISDPATGFAVVVTELRRDLPNLVIYADNAESLQDAPIPVGQAPTRAAQAADSGELGSWKPEAAAWWREMERLTEGGLILVSTRYGWQGLDPDSWIGVGPMSPADVLRMIDSYDELRRLPRDVRKRLAQRSDGHPRTVEFLDDLVEKERQRRGPGWAAQDPWEELIEAVLPEHVERITADLLLAKLWERLSNEACEHAKRVGVLRVPAPRFVIDWLGECTAELIWSSLLTRHRERRIRDGRAVWDDRWGLHSLVRDFATDETLEEEGREAGRIAGLAFREWMKEPGALWSDQVEGIRLLHEVDEGDEAWTMVEEYVIWLRGLARYREAEALLEACEAAGTTADNLARALTLLVQLRRILGDRTQNLREIIERAQTLAVGDQTRAHIIAELGAVLNSQGEYGEAEQLLRHPEYGTSLDELSNLLHSRGKYGEAEQLLRQSLKIKKKSLGEEDPDYGASLHHLAVMLHSQGKCGEAEEFLRQALGIIENSLGKAHPDYGIVLNELAVVLSKRGKYVEAEKLHRQALEILEKSLGKEHPNYGAALHHLAGALSKQGKYGEAEQLLRQSLEINEQSLGKEHPSLCSTLTNLASVLASQGRADEGEPLLQRALAIAGEVFGPSSHYAAQVLLMLAQVQAALGKAEAATTAQQALESLHVSLGPEHPVTLNATPVLQQIIDLAALSPEERRALQEQAQVRGDADQVRDAADQVRDAAIAALQGEADPERLVEALGEAIRQTAPDTQPERDLVTYFEAVRAILEGQAPPEVAAPFQDHLAAIQETRTS